MTTKTLVMTAAIAVGSATITLPVWACNACGCSSKAAAKQESAQVQTTCPVMGGKIDKKQFVDVQGKRIYVCCPSCIDAIKKDPAKYIAKLEKAGVVLEKAPEVTAPAKPATQE